MLEPHDLNIKMWKAMNRDIALSRKLGEELSPAELTTPRLFQILNTAPVSKCPEDPPNGETINNDSGRT